MPRAKVLDPDGPAPRVLQIEGHAPALWLAAGMTLHQPAQKAASVCASPASHAVWLSLDRLSEAWLRRLHPRPQLTVGQPKGIEGRPLFAAQSADLLADAVEQFRERATSMMGGRERDYLPKLADCTMFLQRHLAVSSPGDPVASWLITKTVPKRNASTSYYSSLSLRDVQRYQSAAVVSADSRNTVTGQMTRPEPDIPTVLSDRVIGSRLCPSRQALATLRDHLLANARIGRGAMTPERATEVDHAFTAYCWLFFSLHVGWRPPTSILPGKDDLDWSTGAFFLEDKPVRSRKAAVATEAADAGEDGLEIEDAIALPPAVHDFKNGVGIEVAGGKRRWLPLGERVMEQLRAYHVHLEAREERSLVRPPLKDRAAVLSYLKAIPGLSWDMPWNFPRHYLRSALIGKVSVEVINAYMGHWDFGAEPWWNGSCLDPVAYVHEVRTVLDAVFPKSDWPVLVGFR